MKFNEKLRAVGYMNGTEILELMGFDLGKIVEIQRFFNNKSITDRGAGLSNLLPTIADLSEVGELNAVDPVYQESLFQAKVEKTTDDLMECLGDIEECHEGHEQNGATIEEKRKLERNLRMYSTALAQIEKFNFDDNRIYRLIDIESIANNSQDIIFLNCWLYAYPFDNIMEFLKIANRKLKKGGELVICEYKKELDVDLSEFEVRNNNEVYKCIRIKKGYYVDLRPKVIDNEEVCSGFCPVEEIGSIGELIAGLLCEAIVEIKDEIEGTCLSIEDIKNGDLSEKELLKRAENSGIVVIGG